MEDNIVKIFLNKFTTQDFFKNFIRILLYTSEFNSNIGDKEGIEEYFNRYLIDVKNISDRMSLENRQNINQYTSLIKTILSIRSTGTGIINYNNIYQHVNTQNLLVKNIIDSAVDKPIFNEDDFRKETDHIINQIDYFYDISLTLNNMIEIEQFKEKINKADISIVEAIKDYKEMILKNYSGLSNLHSLSKEESATGYYIIDGEESIKNISSSVVDSISTGYSFYKTGYDLLDNSLEGFESSSVHNIIAPSNHILLVVLKSN